MGVQQASNMRFTQAMLLASALLCAIASAQAPGRGISKTTMACNDPIPGKQFLEKYFPVATPGDECADDTCTCTGGWEILQGRVYATTASAAEVGGGPGNGFGMHFVNVSQSKTTGGMSVAEIEAEFTTKLGDMSTFDSFMDFNAMFYTTGLAAYKATFEADGVGMYTTTWEYDSKTWTSIFIHVPNTQLVLELAQDTTLEGNFAHHNGARASPAAIERALAMVHPEVEATSSVGAIISPLAVNRAVSVSTMAAVEDFYVTGMGTTMVVNSTGGGKEPDFKEYKCFLWAGASVDLCFYSRDDSTTKGDFKVGDFEKMLNTVHANIIAKYPYCARDKWTDNHYAIDSFSADTTKIVSYIDANNVPVYCEGTAPHYVIDPTGWGIQTDLQYKSSPKACSSSVANAGRKLLQHTNPACEAGTCA